MHRGLAAGRLPKRECQAVAFLPALPGVARRAGRSAWDGLSSAPALALSAAALARAVPSSWPSSREGDGLPPPSSAAAGGALPATQVSGGDAALRMARQELDETKKEAAATLQFHKALIERLEGELAAAKKGGGGSADFRYA